MPDIKAGSFCRKNDAVCSSLSLFTVVIDCRPLIQRKLEVLTSVKLSSDSFKEADSRSIHTGTSNQPTLDAFFGEMAAAEETVNEPDSKRARTDSNAAW